MTDPDAESHRIMGDLESYCKAHGVEKCAELVSTLAAAFVLQTAPRERRAASLAQLSAAAATIVAEVEEDEATLQ